MNKYFVWMEMLANGSLQKPKEANPDFGPEHLKQKYLTEMDASEDYQSFYKRNPGIAPKQLLLLPVFEPLDKQPFAI
jgi:hypothetical protein